MEKSLSISQTSDETWLEKLASARVEVQKTVRLASEVFARRWSNFYEWASQPYIRKCIVIGAGILAFVLIFFGISALGFTASGIKAASWASGFQAAAYAGATPAGGWFSGLTSLSMTGQVPLLASTGAIVTITSGRMITQYPELKTLFRKAKRA